MITILVLLATLLWLLPQIIPTSGTLKQVCLIAAFVLVLACFLIAISVIAVHHP